MRKAEDPLWDMGIGFGQVPDRGSHLQLPWEQGTFSFLSDAAGSEDQLQSLLRRPEPALSQRFLKKPGLLRHQGCMRQNCVQ